MLRILLIESDSTAAQYLQGLLYSCGHMVEVMPDGLIALAELERRRELPQLICIRVEIPRMSGYSVCNKIKRRAVLRDIPLVLLSSQATPETFAQHKRLRTCADGYLAMPFSDEQFWFLVESLIPGSSVNDNETANEMPSLAQAGFATTPAESDHFFYGANHSSMYAGDSERKVEQKRTKAPANPYEAEPGTAQLKAGDIVLEELHARVDSDHEHAEILDIAELEEDDALELSEEDVEDSHDFHNRSQRLQESNQGDEQTIIPAREVVPRLATKVVMVRRGQDAFESFGQGHDSPYQELVTQVPSSDLSPSSLSSLSSGWETAQQLQKLWGDSIHEGSSDTIEPTMIAGQAPSVLALKHADFSDIPDASDDAVEEDTLSSSGKKSSPSASSRQQEPSGSRNNGAGSPAMLFVKVPSTPTPPGQGPTGVASKSKAKTNDSKPPASHGNGSAPAGHGNGSAVVRANGHTTGSGSVVGTEPLDFEDTSYSSRRIEDFANNTREAKTSPPQEVTPSSTSQEWLHSQPGVEAWERLEEENLQLRETVTRLSLENLQLRQNAELSSALQQDDSLSAFISRQLDAIEENQPIAVDEKQESVVVVKNIDTIDIADSGLAQEEKKNWERLRSEYRERLDILEKENQELRSELDILHSQQHSDSSGSFRSATIIQDPSAVQHISQEQQAHAVLLAEDTAFHSLSTEQTALIIGLRKELDDKEQNIADLCARIRELEDTYPAQLESLQTQLSSWLEQQEQWAAIEKEHAAQTDLLQAWEQRFHALEQEYEALQRIFQTKEIELEQLDDSNRDLYHRLESREAEQRELRAELASLRIQCQGQTATDDELLIQTAEKEKELHLLRHELNDLGEHYDTLERNHSALVSEHKRVTEELKLRNNALLTLDNERNTLAEDIVRARQKDTTKEKELKDFQQQIRLLEKDIESLHEEIDSIALERNRFRDEMLQLSNELDASREEMRNVRGRDGELREEVEQLQEQLRRLKQEHEQSKQKSQQRVQNFQALEDEVVSLRQKNLLLEQQQFETEELLQRLQQEREDVGRQLNAEKGSRQHHISQIDQYEERTGQLLTELETWQEKQKIWYTQKQEYQQICEGLRNAVEELTARCEQLEQTEQALQTELTESWQAIAQQQEQWQAALQEQQEQRDHLVTSHQQELLEMQTDWEQDTQQQLQHLRWEVENHWQQQFEQEQQRWNQQQEELLTQQDTVWQGQKEEWQTIHTMELERVQQEYHDQLAEQQALHRAEIEQLQHELQEQQLSASAQWEEENKRLRKQLRDMEQEYRQEKIQQREASRAEIDRRVQEVEQQVSLRHQAMLEGLQQRETELEKSLERLKREQGQQQTQREEAEIELEHMRNQVADLETLRRHERNELVRLKKEREQQEVVLQERIDELEKALQERRVQASELYQRLKQQESQRDHTAQALRNALSLLGTQAAHKQEAESESGSTAEREEKVLAEIARLAKLDF